MKFSARIKATIEVYCACLLHQQLGLVLHQQQERAQAMSEATAEMVVGDEHRKDILGSALNSMVKSAPPAQRMAFPVATERPDMSRILETRESKSSCAPWYRDAFRGDAVN